jgi:nitrate reductase NapE component
MSYYSGQIWIYMILFSSIVIWGWPLLAVAIHGGLRNLISSFAPSGTHALDLRRCAAPILDGATRSSGLIEEVIRFS